MEEVVLSCSQRGFEAGFGLEGIEAFKGTVVLGFKTKVFAFHFGHSYL